MTNLDNNITEIQKKNYSYGAQPPKPEVYVCFPEDSLFNGYFNMGDGTLSYANTKGVLDCDETKKQIVKYNDDNTATVETYYLDDKGRADGTIDEIINVSLDGRSASGFPIPIINDVEYNIDAKIDNYMQGEKKDCSFLACLSSISQTYVGKEILQDAISKNDDNSYSVTFKGIEKTVIITQDELLEASQSGNYAQGDKTVLLLELGAEKAINELYNEIGITKDEFNKYYTNTLTQAEYSKVEEFIKTYWSTGLFDSCMDGKGESPIEHFSPLKFAQLFGISRDNYNMYGFSGNNTDTISNILNNIDLSNSLTHLSFKTEVGFISDKGNDFKVYTNHAYTIKQYNKDEGTITIVNPHHSYDSLTISIEELAKYGDILEFITLNK